MKDARAVVLAALFLGSFVSCIMFYALGYPLITSLVGGLIAYLIVSVIGAIVAG